MPSSFLSQGHLLSIQWSWNWISIAADRGFDPLGIRKYKIHRPKSAGDSPSNELVRTAILTTLLKRFTLEPFTLYFLYTVAVWFGMSFRTAPPSFGTTVVQLFEAAILGSFSTVPASFLSCLPCSDDILFCSLHGACHYFPRLYFLHKQHHEFKATTSFTAEYASLFENVVVTFTPMVLLPIVQGHHFAVLLMVVAIRLIRTYVLHSGYFIPWVMSEVVLHHGPLPSRNLLQLTMNLDWHHSRNIGNYGDSPLFDLIFGTYNQSWFDDLKARRGAGKKLVKSS